MKGTMVKWYEKLDCLRSEIRTVLGISTYLANRFPSGRVVLILVKVNDAS